MKYGTGFLGLLLFLMFAGGVANNTWMVPEGLDGEVVYVPFPVTIRVDGDVRDWSRIPPVTVIGRGPMLSTNPDENGSFSFSTAANETHFFIMMSTRDKTIITGQHVTDFWNEDSLEFYLNFSGDLGAATYDPRIYQIIIHPGDTGSPDPSTVTLTGTNSLESGTLARVFSTEKGWGFEAAVPLRDIVPVHGLTIGFQAHANGASVLDRDVKLIWSKADTGDLSWQNPSLFGRAVFYEVGRSDTPLPDLPLEGTTPMPPVSVAVNQHGYYPDAAKFAAVVHPSAQPLAWSLLNASDDVVAEGETFVYENDRASGDTVHRIDFSGVDTTGQHTLMVDGEAAGTLSIKRDLYRYLLRDSLKYYYLSRAGVDIREPYSAPAWTRSAGHRSDAEVTCYSGTDADGREWPGCDYTVNAIKGWYDAGDYGKYVVNSGISVWTLLNMYERNPRLFADGDLNIPESGNGVPDVLDEVRWNMEFMLAMQVPEGQPQAGLVHHKLHALAWDGFPVRPAAFDESRFLFPVTTAATLNLAATAAQCARIWREFDAAFADRCLEASRRAWMAAEMNPALKLGNTPGAGGGNYPDNRLSDEFYWAASELYITTGEVAFYEYVTSFPHFDDLPFDISEGAASMAWADTNALGTISLLTVDHGLSDEQRDRLAAQVVRTAERYLQIILNEGYGLPLTDRGYIWGSNSAVLNNGLVMAVAYDLTGDRRFRDGALSAMDYVLGRNALNKSFVTGYGEHPPLHIHHRFWANQPDNGYPAPPPGVLVGGPYARPEDPAAGVPEITKRPVAKRYIDHNDSWSTNEITINWNAPLAWMSAFLTDVMGE